MPRVGSPSRVPDNRTRFVPAGWALVPTGGASTQKLGGGVAVRSMRSACYQQNVGMLGGRGDGRPVGSVLEWRVTCLGTSTKLNAQYLDTTGDVWMIITGLGLRVDPRGLGSGFGITGLDTARFIVPRCWLRVIQEPPPQRRIARRSTPTEKVGTARWLGIGSTRL